MSVPQRQVRAVFTADTVTVYQAYPPEIARPAVRAGRLVPPFKRDRMTWIKPSFLWMMYRSGWATKPGQEHVLAVELRRDGFEWALRHACLSDYDRDLYADHDEWARSLKASPVRVQWDPERAPDLTARPYRSLQVGLSQDAVGRYVDDWTVGIVDITDEVNRVHALPPGDRANALPPERPYPLPDDVAAAIGAR